MLVDNAFIVGYEHYLLKAQYYCLIQYFHHNTIKSTFVEFIKNKYDISYLKKYLPKNIPISDDIISCNNFGQILYNTDALGTLKIYNIIGSDFLNRQAKINMLLE